MKIWNKNNGTCINTLIGHTRGVSCIIQLSDGNIVSGSNDYTLKIWYVKEELINLNTINIFTENLSTIKLPKFIQLLDLYKNSFIDFNLVYKYIKDLEDFDLSKFYNDLLRFSVQHKLNIFGENNIGTFIDNVVKFIFSIKQFKNTERLSNKPNNFNNKNSKL